MNGRKKLLIIFSVMASTVVLGSVIASIVLYVTGNELKPIQKPEGKNENNLSSSMGNE